MLQQIDKEVFKKQIDSYKTRINLETVTDELFKEIKNYLTGVLKLRGKVKWLESKELCRKIKLARYSCKIKSIRDLSRHITEIEICLQEK